MHDEDDTLEDAEELLREIRERRSSGGAVAVGGDSPRDERPVPPALDDDETIVVRSQSVSENRVECLMSDDDEDTIDVDPKVMRKLRSAPAADVLDEDATVADMSSLDVSRRLESSSGSSEADVSAPTATRGHRVLLWTTVVATLVAVAVLMAAATVEGWWGFLVSGGADPQIAFTSNSQLYVMDTDDTNPRKVSDKADVIFPVWSPDKTRIAFYGGGEPGPFELFVIDPDGLNLLQLTAIGIEEGALPPSWSPDGTRIAFFGVRKLSDSSFISDVLHIVDADGSRLQRIGDRVSYAEWSPDGSRIAFDQVEFLGDGSFRGNVFLIDANGSNVRRLTTGGSDYLVGWLPNGLALGRDRPNWNSFEITLVDEDGSLIRHLLDLPKDEFIYSVSPNGERFLLARMAGNGGELSVIDVDGANRIRLTDDYEVSHTSWPVWSPDGTMIAYISDQDGDDEVYAVRADGADLRQLTRNEVQEGIGSWK